MSLKNLSKHLPLERTSISFKLSSTAQLKTTKNLQSIFDRQLTDLRESNWPDRGISFNLTDCVRLNKDFKIFILQQIKNVLKKNIVNLDLWVSKNPSKELKDFISEIQTEIDKNNKTSVRIRVARSKKTYNPFLILNWFIGIFLVVLGSLPFLKSTEIKTKFIEGLNATQLVGLLLVLVSLIPYIFKFIKLIKDKKND